MIVKNCPIIEQPTQQQPKFKPPNCPSCKRNLWLEFDRGWYCQSCEYIINKHQHQIAEKVHGQDHFCSTRLNYANKEMKEIWMNMVNTTHRSTKDMINKLQQLKGKTKIKFCKNTNNYYDNMNNKMDEDLFAEKVQGTTKS